jgi:uncharacterized RDD family membrane protein YckC/cytoskeletal protein CcmA (bactofilin family)
MKFSVRPLCVGAAIAFFFTFALAVCAQEQPSPSPAAAPSSESTPAVAPAAPAPEIEKPVAVEKSTLRRIDNDEDAVATAAQPAPAAKHGRRPVHRPGNSGNDYVRFAANIEIAQGDTVDGDVFGILGDVTIDGEAKSDVTSILGSTTINGKVAGDVVAVLGDVTLGPKAIVEGDVTTVRGALHRDPGAIVQGRITQHSMGGKSRSADSFQVWWDKALSHGSWLGFGRGLGWLTMLTLVALGFYTLIALVFPAGIRSTGDMLVQRPAAVVFSAILTMIALPVLFVLLLITVIGIPVALLALPAGVIIGVAFGKASIYALVGRSVAGDKFPPAVAVLIGGAIFVLLYFIPVLGLALSLLVSALGLGCAVTALLTSNKKTSTPPLAPASPPAAAASSMVPLAPPVIAPTAGFTAPLAGNAPFVEPTLVENTPAAPPSPDFGSPDPVTPMAPAEFALPMATSLPPKLPATPNATLPRAGFWIRTGGVLIDLVIVAVICGPIGAGAIILPGLAAYGAVMWKLKGTTVGGIVCGLRVVRLDDRPIDWPTAVVRALGCFLSLVVGGLGFVWVVFDGERQSWHDKIAGTVVVRAPKGVSLV